eukprot:10607813-Alexandrium_andersonii.AAC.1
MSASLVGSEMCIRDSLSPAGSGVKTFSSARRSEPWQRGGAIWPIAHAWGAATSGRTLSPEL